MIVAQNAEIHIGKDVFLNANNVINSNTTIRIEDKVITGWNCQLLDWDGHDIYDMASKEIINSPKPITIGKHAWIGAGATLLKGVSLAPDVIVPANSTITNSCTIKNAIWGGSPNKVLKQNIKRADE